MKPCVFVGPTISVAEARRHLDALYMPPVQQGDVISVLRHRPQVIGIIDGYFERVPSVWHKEILLALSEGVHVVGAASMGALRAAELHTFGMRGVGEIFRWYRDGLIEADDEVAVVHAPAGFDYQQFSEAMVNIRKNLQTVRDAGVISQATLESLIQIAKKMRYQERSYQHLLEKATRCKLPDDQISGLSSRLAEHTIDQKKLDAIESLAVINELVKSGHPPTIDFELQRTVFLEHLIDRDRVVMREDEFRITAEELADHARLECEEFEHLQRSVTTNSLLCQFARHLEVTVTDEELQGEADNFRQIHGLTTTQATTEWMNQIHIDEGEFEELIEEWVLAGKMHAHFMDPHNRPLLNHLRLQGLYSRIARSSMNQAKALAEPCLSQPELPDSRSLYAYYFQQKGRPVPEDIEEYARRLGFSDEKSFLKEVKKYYLYHNKARR